MKNRYPFGQLNKHDEGELTIAMHIEENVVRIDFGKPVAWLGLPPAQARQFAQMLIGHAETIEQGMQ